MGVVEEREDIAWGGRYFFVSDRYGDVGSIGEEYGGEVVLEDNEAVVVPLVGLGGMEGTGEVVAIDVVSVVGGGMGWYACG